jgi:hypothetical protein
LTDRQIIGNPSNFFNETSSFEAQYALDILDNNCLQDYELIMALINKRPSFINDLNIPDEYKRKSYNENKEQYFKRIETYLKGNRAVTAKLVADYLNKQKYHEEPRTQKLTTALPIGPVGFCKDKQPTTVKISFPFNPTFETNALKASQNNSSDFSFGFGGALQLITAGARDYDLIVLSAGSTTARYDRFPSKSLDAITTTAAYQFFLDAFGYKNGNLVYIDGKPEPTKIPAQNMITVDTVAVGVQNQIAYLPTFRAETADLFTPQVTLSRQNAPLFGGDKNNECTLASGDRRKNGFCYYTDLSLTAGQTFSDVRSQQNANVAASATIGRRFDKTDWKLAVQAVATGRVYEDFVGGRQDVLLQIGPTFTYAPSAIVDSTHNTAFTFSVAATYNRNFSTVSAAAWHGFIVLPTLTIAFQPAPPPK